MKLRPSCSMCLNFDAIRKHCILLHTDKTLDDKKSAEKCSNEGRFVRDINVLPSLHNYFDDNDPQADYWQQDLSKLPKDENGVPLFVYTHRGTERAIPANGDVHLQGDIFTGVPRIHTRQGQREAIKELGVDLARIEAEKNGVPLTVLPGEELEQGMDMYKKRVSSIKSMWVHEEGKDGLDW
ncbi:hypothetical protein [Alkalihalophilus marmarensis]|uniref:hypothetical protein n=1 Tax=Alkalihalophilus marmarensis TaxID=521377 RepID=UPI002DC03CE1|nr:hypothetical protein [Alkalihalophilus marmarensis]MEC2074238.1 hypothetical protein [Alkalihalophilus marmarensis]